MTLYCRKYTGMVTQGKAFDYCLLCGCPHLTRWSKKMGKGYPRRWATDSIGRDKSR